ncbi:MAG: hypothetical protein ABS882_02565 [Lysinibacillus sp.]
MNAEEIWGRLVNECKESPLALQTKTGLNFNLTSNGNRLLVIKSEVNPSSQLKMPRPIYKDNFLRVFPYYERLKVGEKNLSREILKNTRNSVYILSAIKYCLD